MAADGRIDAGDMILSVSVVGITIINYRLACMIYSKQRR